MSTPSFVEWLHAQASADKSGDMPYADCYPLGPLIDGIIGSGDFDFGRIAAVIREEAETEWDATFNIEALTKAEAGWRMDCVVYEMPAEMEEASKSAVSKTTTGSSIVPHMTVLQCGYRTVDGSGCKDKVVEGSARCAKHGGAITDPEVRRSMLLITYAKLFQGGPTAIEALLEVAEYGRSDMARVQAAKELLDRAGVVMEQQTQLHNDRDTISEDEQLAALRERLDTTKDRLKLVAVPVVSASKDDEIVEAEIVEEAS